MNLYAWLHLTRNTKVVEFEALNVNTCIEFKGIDNYCKDIWCIADQAKIHLLQIHILLYTPSNCHGNPRCLSGTPGII